MDIAYKVEFFTDWHCGSGLAAGADVDALVVKDRDGLPYIPGKTIKGLLREAVDDIIAYRYHGSDKRSEYEKLVKEYFGFFDGTTDEADLKREMLIGKAHFTNATLPDADRAAIVKRGLQPYLYRNISSTAIDNGIAVSSSLRRSEVTVPCSVEGQILNLPDDDCFKEIITDAMRYIKRLGQNRNRGLGRCSFSPNIRKK